MLGLKMLCKNLISQLNHYVFNLETEKKYIYIYLCSRRKFAIRQLIQIENYYSTTPITYIDSGKGYQVVLIAKHLCDTKIILYTL